MTREASGTSGMTAAMNGSVNFSTYDGWICEFAEDGKNSFIIPTPDPNLTDEERDRQDMLVFYAKLKGEILPLYYGKRKQWDMIAMQSMKDVAPYFDSDRMAAEYYEVMYH